MNYVKASDFDPAKIIVADPIIRKFFINGDKSKEGSYKQATLAYKYGSGSDRFIIQTGKVFCFKIEQNKKYKTDDYTMKISFNSGDENATLTAKALEDAYEETCRRISSPDYLKQFADAKGKVPSADRIIGEMKSPIYRPSIEGANPSMFLDIKKDCSFFEPVSHQEIDYSKLEGLSFECILEIQFENVYFGTKTKIRIAATKCLITKIVKKNSIVSFASVITQEYVDDMAEDLASLPIKGKASSIPKIEEITESKTEDILNSVPSIEAAEFST